MLDKNEAPEGFEAVEKCVKCDLFNLHKLCADTPCMEDQRKDRKNVIIVRKKPSKEYECWAYIWENGSICAESEFKSEKHAWISMVGRHEHYIEAAKARGDRVVRVKITEIE